MSLRRIYLDANALFSRWPGDISGELKILANLAQRAGVEIYIPETVILEHKHGTARRAAEAIKKAQKILDDANRSVNRVVGGITISDFDQRAFLDAHDAAVTDAAKKYQFLTCPSTKRSVQDFVQMGARHAPPFKNEDLGFRDAVHLWSVIDHMMSVPLQAGDSALLVSAEGRLSEGDVAGLIASHKVNLTVEKALSNVVRQVTDALPQAPRHQLAQLAFLWAASLSDDAQRTLEPTIMSKVVGLPLLSSGWEIFTPRSAGSVKSEPAMTSVAASEEQARRYDVNFDVWVSFKADCEWTAQTTRTWGFVSEISLLVDIDAVVDVNDNSVIQVIEYLSARAFSVHWTDMAGVRQGGNYVPAHTLFASTDKLKLRSRLR